MSNDRLGVLEAEVQSLRAEVRRARRFRWAIGLGCLSLGLVAAKLAPSVVRAERFELTDESGEIRGVLAADINGPYLKLVDRQGGQALLEVREGEATLFLDRKDGSGVDPVDVAVVTEPPPPPIPNAVVPPKEAPGTFYGPARIQLVGDVEVQGVKLICPKTDVREYIPLTGGGVIDLLAVPNGDWCVATLTGGQPGRIPVEPYDDLSCEAMPEGWFKCAREELRGR